MADLNPLVLSPSSVSDDSPQNTFVGALTGQTAGSTLSFIDSDIGRFSLSDLNILVGSASLTGLAGTTRNIIIRETLAGYANSPLDTTLSIMVVPPYSGPLWMATGAVISGRGGVTPAIPSGTTAGDFLLLIAETAAQPVTTPTGWSAALTPAQSTGAAAGTASTRLSVFYKDAVAGQTAPVIADPGNHIIAKIHRFSNCTIAETATGSVAATASGIVTIPSVTTTTNNNLIVGLVTVATDINTARIFNLANPNLQNVIEQSDDATALGNGGGVAMGTGQQLTAGTTGTWSATAGTSSTQALMSIILTNPVAPTTRHQPRHGNIH